jgi:anti-sigma B factor antagonist
MISPYPPLFAVTVVHRDGERRLALSGELDRAVVPELLTVLETEERQRPAELRIDLSELTFMDLSGLRTFLDATARGREDDRRVIVMNPQPLIQRLFGLTHAHRILRVEFD